MKKIDIADKPCKVWKRSGSLVEQIKNADIKPKFTNKLVLRKDNAKE